MCPSMWRSDQEFVFMEEQPDRAVQQHQAGSGVEVRFPAARLGVPSRSSRPHAGRGHWTQIFTVNAVQYTEDSPLPPLTPSSSDLHLTN